MTFQQLTHVDMSWPIPEGKTWHILNPLAWWGVWLIKLDEWRNDLINQWVGKGIVLYIQSLSNPDPWADFPAPKWAGYPD